MHLYSVIYIYLCGQVGKGSPIFVWEVIKHRVIDISLVCKCKDKINVAFKHSQDVITPIFQFPDLRITILLGPQVYNILCAIVVDT